MIICQICYLGSLIIKYEKIHFNECFYKLIKQIRLEYNENEDQCGENIKILKKIAFFALYLINK